MAVSFVVSWLCFGYNWSSFDAENQESWFPFGLNLNKYLVGPKNIDYMYDLISVSQHYGASFGGHYTSVCKKINDWYEFDDDDITKIDEEQIVNSNAYVLIYKLRE